MVQNSHRNRNRTFILSGLGVALLVAIFLSPFASQNPDGLDRVAEDLEFDDQATPDPAAQQLPFFQVFEEYALRGVPEAIATPLAGLTGTLVTFGVAWGLGQLVMQGKGQEGTKTDDSLGSEDVPE